ncbi:uncharacterized protein LOC123290714 [Chrysoperla carnea]|uniref:uncharacterized protein LOC123290714 n=1 Tax=Chrysoperla carnea TaxID=189513 RepID=UPI001D0774E0|nr:uncharacterized protein LOC123290714 [Chrysoperla carnea]
MNEVLDEIANGRLFPTASYYKKQQNSIRREDLLKPKISKRSSIWVSDKIIRKMDIMQNADLNNDQQMFDIIEALDDAHSDLNGLTPNYLQATIDQLETNPIIRDSTYVGDARHEVMNCLSENPRLPLKCSKQINMFLQTIKNSTSCKCNVLADRL